MKRILGYLKRMIRDPRMIVNYANVAGLLKWMPDVWLIRLMWKLKMDTPLNLKDPRTFNEKLQWLKLYNQKPEYGAMVDKYEVKDLVGKAVGYDHVIPTLGVWDHFSDIDFSALPEKFVLKCTHDSGGLVICKDKWKLDIGEAKRILEKCLAIDYYTVSREWPYKHVKPRILAEQYMEDGTGNALQDYKVLCFNGEPRLIELHKGRFTDNHTQDFYNTDWERQTVSQCGCPLAEELEPRPKLLEQMLQLSRVLARGIPHVRVDWYIIGDQLYFGELTFFDASGFNAFDDPADDAMMGDWITLPPKTVSR